MKIKTLLLTFSSSLMFFSCLGMENNNVSAPHDNSLKRARENTPEELNESNKRHKGENAEVESTPEITFFQQNLQAASNGDSIAQCNVGVMYGVGQGVPQDFGQAIYWYSRAVAQGNEHALLNLNGVFELLSFDNTIPLLPSLRHYYLGILYENGWGIAPNVFGAFVHYQLAADDGIAAAQAQLGMMYAAGNGTFQDFEQAIIWFEKAAQQGNMLAQEKLVQLYASGKGVEKDLPKAIIWFEKAAQQGNMLAQEKLVQLYASGKGVEKDLGKASDWCGVLASKNYEPIDVNNFQSLYDQLKRAHYSSRNYYCIAILYEKGWGTQKDINTAFKYYEFAAKEKNSAAQFKLGVMYATGEGTLVNRDKSIKFFVRAARQGNVEAQKYLWDYFSGFPNDEIIPDRDYHLGMLYENGWGTHKDIELALQLYQQASYRGNKDATLSAGILYHRQGDEKAMDTAQAYYRMAMDQGHPKPGKMINRIANGDILTLPIDILIRIWNEAYEAHAAHQNHLNKLWDERVRSLWLNSSYNNSHRQLNSLSLSGQITICGLDLICQKYREIRNDNILDFKIESLVEDPKFAKEHINFFNSLKNLKLLYWNSYFGWPKEAVELLANLTHPGLSVIMAFEQGQEPCNDNGCPISEEIDGFPVMLKNNKSITSLELKNLGVPADNVFSHKVADIYVGLKIYKGLKKNTTLTSLKLPLTHTPFPFIKKLLRKRLFLTSLDVSWEEKIKWEKVSEKLLPPSPDASWKEKIKWEVRNKEINSIKKIITLAITLSSYLKLKEKKIVNTHLKEIKIGISDLDIRTLKENYKKMGISDEELIAYENALEYFKHHRLSIT